MRAPTRTLAVAAFMALVAVGAAVPLREASAGSALGDANCDGDVSAIDAALVLQYGAGLLTSMPCLEKADANGDGSINALDAALILQVGAGFITHIKSPSEFITFGSGTHIVGTDFPAGTYRTRQDSGGCYWARLSGFGGTFGEIIANEFGVGPQVVTIAPSDAGFESSNCGTWTGDLSRITPNQTASFGNGTFIVGVDVAPGTWRSGQDDCYWARLSGFSGNFGDIIANDFGGNIVTIAASDVGFTSSGCGTWELVS